MLGFAHYLDRKAAQALKRIEPHLALDPAGLQALRYRLTTLPARPTLVASLLGIATALAVVAVAPVVFPEVLPALGVDRSDLGVVGFAVIIGAAYFVGGAFVVHTIHQLQMVRSTYRDNVTVDVLDLTPLYAFSNLTAITAIGLVAQGYTWLITNPGLVGAGIGVITVTLVSVLAGVVFAVPLWGIHRRIVDEKARLARETARRRRTMAEALFQGIDARDLAQATAIKDAVIALDTQEQAIGRIRPWPWEPETIRLLLTAVLLPSALFVTQFILQRALGGP